jgi:dihydropteroate synthase
MQDFVGETLDLPLDQCLEANLAAVAFAVAAGANVVRVHEVQPTVRAVRMTEAILGRPPPVVTRRGLA